MSLSVALANGLSGLTANGRTAETISNNIANALTPGYAARESVREPASLGGVSVTAVTRRVDPAILQDRREADAEVGLRSRNVRVFDQIAAAIGEAGDLLSLPGRIARLEARLVEAASNPQSDLRLSAGIDAARDVATQLNGLTDSVQAERLSADNEIANKLDALGSGLNRVDELNEQIVVKRILNEDTAGLEDLRQRAIDSISSIVPMREMPLGDGKVGLITAGGQILLGDRVAELSFAAAGAIGPGATLGAPLSGLAINGLSVDMTRIEGKMSGGELDALFALRDKDLPEIQARLDGFARELIERLGQPGIDPTKPASDPGLFTDASTAFSPSNELGVAGRIRLNAAIDPEQGGAIWRLRDGTGAVTPGASGDARIMNRILEALASRAPSASPALGTPARSVGGHADEILATVAYRAYEAETDLGYMQSRADTLKAAELRLGVDTDSELQKLLLVEQAYAANAQVMKTADELLQLILEIA